MQQGQSFGDDDLVKLLHRRLQQSDVKKNGWILENFPQTRDQAHQMAQRSILPNNVLVLHVEPQTVYKRCADDKSFECIGDILSQRLDKAAVTLP
jgi:adenylate kinase